MASVSNVKHSEFINYLHTVGSDDFYNNIKFKYSDELDFNEEFKMINARVHEQMLPSTFKEIHSYTSICSNLIAKIDDSILIRA